MEINDNDILKLERNTFTATYKVIKIEGKMVTIQQLSSTFPDNNPNNQHGFIQTVHTESAEAYEAHRLETMLEDLNCEHLLADKAYDTVANRDLLKKKKVKNRILQKAIRNKPLTKRQKRRNILISKTRYKVERCFGTLKRKFNFTRASYFSTIKVNAQALLKAMCFNVLKAVNLMA